MATGYWVATSNVTDQEKYKAYIAANAEPFKKVRRRFLVAGRPLRES